MSDITEHNRKMREEHTPPLHIPPPWIHSENHPTDIISEKGDFIARCVNTEHAAFIVRAVNAHDYLLWALKAALPWMGRDGEDLTGEGKQELHNAIEGMKAAIVKAEGK